jgi:hypothetical protein
VNENESIRVIEDTAAPRVLTEREALDAEVLTAARQRLHVNKLCWNHVKTRIPERVVTANQNGGTKDRPRATNEPHVNPNRIKGTKAEKKSAKRQRHAERQ